MNKQLNALDSEAYLKDLEFRLKQAIGKSVLSIEPLTGGMNNLLYKVAVEGGQTYVAKRYHQDQRQRLRREYDVLTVLHEKGFEEVPVPMFRFDDLQVGIYSFVHARQIQSADFSTHELDAIVAYLTKLQAISPSEVAIDLLRAESSAFSLAEVVDLIMARVKPFQEEEGRRLHPNTTAFIQETGVFAFVEERLAQCRQEFATRFDQQILREYQRLSSVDSGPHNMLWSDDKKLTVLDFEYAGWDHPLREVGNLLAHSKMRGLSDDQKSYFVKQYLQHTTLPTQITGDLEGFRMLSEIEWIILNMTYLLPSRITRLQQLKGPEYDVDAHLETYMQEIQERMEALMHKSR
jgi:thiamine kinase-like enzyme